ncbi:hypothetical protein HK104_006878 [Borealophlyctis nickersoniae]|nr:hypothetical protein HK104_006878 [Borealophlyctis nickersoniae]
MSSRSSRTGKSSASKKRPASASAANPPADVVPAPEEDIQPKGDAQAPGSVQSAGNMKRGAREESGERSNEGDIRPSSMSVQIRSQGQDSSDPTTLANLTIPIPNGTAAKRTKSKSRQASESVSPISPTHESLPGSNRPRRANAGKKGIRSDEVDPQTLVAKRNTIKIPPSRPKSAQNTGESLDAKKRKRSDSSNKEDEESKRLRAQSPQPPVPENADMSIDGGKLTIRIPSQALKSTGEASAESNVSDDRTGAGKTEAPDVHGSRKESGERRVSPRAHRADAAKGSQPTETNGMNNAPIQQGPVNPSAIQVSPDRPAATMFATAPPSDEDDNAHTRSKGKKRANSSDPDAVDRASKKINRGTPEPSKSKPEPISPTSPERNRKGKGKGSAVTTTVSPASGRGKSTTSAPSLGDSPQNTRRSNNGRVNAKTAATTVTLGNSGISVSLTTHGRSLGNASASMNIIPSQSMPELSSSDNDAGAASQDDADTASAVPQGPRTARQIRIDEEIAAVEKEIAMIKNGTHPDFMAAKTEIDARYAARNAIVDTKFRLQTASIHQVYDASVLQAKHTFISRRRDIRCNMLNTISHKRWQLEAEYKRTLEQSAMTIAPAVSDPVVIGAKRKAAIEEAAYLPSGLPPDREDVPKWVKHIAKKRRGAGRKPVYVPPTCTGLNDLEAEQDLQFIRALSQQ